jgi:prephenate dehydratase
VFEAVATSQVDYGIVPVENSLTGSIHQNFDLMLEQPTTIVGEIKLRIVHNLIAHAGVSIRDINTIYAHFQAAAQCDDFLRAHPGWQVINVYDTAGSVDYIKTHGLKQAAAIAGAETAALYDMEVLKEGIESHAGNFTRFLVVARQGSPSEAADKTSLVFETHHQPGSLAKVLQLVAQHQVNLVKLESRPIPGQPWEYLFYADLQIAPGHASWEALLAALQQETQHCHVLGSYHAAG